MSHQFLLGAGFMRYVFQNDFCELYFSLLDYFIVWYINLSSDSLSRIHLITWNLLR